MTTPRARLPFRLLVPIALLLLQAALPESADASYISVGNQRIDRALHER